MPIYSGVETPLLPKSMTAPLMVLGNISTHIHAHPHHRHPLSLFLLLERTGCEKRDEKISSRSNDPWPWNRGSPGICLKVERKSRLQTTTSQVGTWRGRNIATGTGVLESGAQGLRSAIKRCHADLAIRGLGTSDGLDFAGKSRGKKGYVVARRIRGPQGKISIRHLRTRRGPREQGPESLTYTSEWVRGGTCRAIAAKLGNSGKAHKPHARSEMNRCRRGLTIGGLGTPCEDLA